jgi:hypothetical protein
MENGTDTGAAAQITAKIEMPEVQEVIAASFKAILDSVSPAAIPAIAMLTREYTRQGKSRDEFFHGAIEMLMELGAHEIDVLRMFCEWVISAECKDTLKSPT